MLCILKKIIHKLHYSTNIVKYYNPSNFIYIYIYIYQPLAMGWTVLESNFGGGVRYLPPVQTGPGTYRASCTMDTG